VSQRLRYSLVDLKSWLVLALLVLVAPIAGMTLARDNPPMARDLFDFHLAESTAGWSAIDDAVMGGISASRLRHDSAGHAVFEGVVSLDNNGGFASVRSRPGELGAPGAVSYVLDVRGDGKRYKLNLRTDDAFDGVNYQAAFEAPRDQWTTVRLPVAEFRPTLRGGVVATAPPLDPARVRQVGLMIADRQAGAFRLAVRSIGVE
jgi:NADH dehydrogenase [ubiquinone] 1 alpha subcomplex assembly factor 1